MRSISLVAVAGLSALVFGCVASTEATSNDGTSTDEQEVTAANALFVVTPDYRKCVSPLCGGHWVKQINASTTRCADGSYKATCYVATLDLATIPMDPNDVHALSSFVAKGAIKAKTYPNFGNLGKFSVTELWTPATTALPTGTFYTVHDNGIRCFRAPCFSMDADKVNASTTVKISGLAGEGADKAGDVVMGHNTPIIGAGTFVTATNGGRNFNLTQWYRKVEASLTYCNADADCTATAFNKPINSSGDCYCAMCPTTAANASVAASYQKSWNNYCLALMCPMVKCIAPLPVACVSNTCQFVTP